jgi:hypothetical protein
MTSAEDAALQMKNALRTSTSEEKLAIFQEFANLCGIPAIVVNELTLADFGNFPRTARTWKNYFHSTNALIERYLSSLGSLRSSGSLNDKQEMFYMELMIFQNAIELFGSCNTDEKMLQWVRGFSALDFVSTAMSEAGILSEIFMGNLRLSHKIRGKKPWSDGSKLHRVLSELNNQVKKMARWARVETDKQNDEVDELLFQARLDNLREDPLKLTGIDRLVQAFADEAARNFLAKLAQLAARSALALKKN